MVQQGFLYLYVLCASLDDIRQECRNKSTEGNDAYTSQRARMTPSSPLPTPCSESKAKKITRIKYK